MNPLLKPQKLLKKKNHKVNTLNAIFKAKIINLNQSKNQALFNNLKRRFIDTILLIKNKEKTLDKKRISKDYQQEIP